MKNFEVRIFSSKNLNEKWYVYIYHNSKIIKKIYKGINSESTFKERMLKAETLKKIIEQEIIDGWNPQSKNKPSRMTLFDALDFGVEKKKASLSKGSYGEYSIAVGLFKHYGEKEGLKGLFLHNCERSHIKTVLNAARDDRKWSAMNYNKTLRRISSIFSELIEWDLISFNPARDIKPLKEEQTGGYDIMTDKEHKIVFNHLKKFHYNYYIFCSLVYYMGIRMGELLRLKCSNVDMEREVITIEPENSKSKKLRIVPMIGTTKELISTLDLSNPDYYLFGAPKSGKIHKLLDNYFCPNPYEIKRAYPTNIWKKEIIIGLGIDKKIYSLKHKGGNDKLKAGIDLKTVSTIFGHSSQKITEIYANYINDIRFDNAKNIKLDEY